MGGRLSVASPTNRPQPKVIKTTEIIKLKLWPAAGFEAKVATEISSYALVNIYEETPQILQIRIGRDVSGGVQPIDEIDEKNHFKSTFPSTCSLLHHNYTKQEQFIQVQAC